jgi:hypothetical protein
MDEKITRTSVEQIVLEDRGDSEFIASFMYNSHNLTTRPMGRASSVDSVKAAIKEVVEVWKSKRAEDNFAVLKSELENKTVEL